jgi:hypothetical protein
MLTVLGILGLSYFSSLVGSRFGVEYRRSDREGGGALLSEEMADFETPQVHVPTSNRRVLPLASRPAL